MAIDYTRRPSEPAPPAPTWGARPAQLAPLPPPGPTSGRSRRPLIAGAAVVALLGAAGAGYVVFRPTAPTAPEDRVLPAPATGAEAERLRAYLRGDGQALVRLPAALPASLAGEVVDGCAALVRRLQGVGSPKFLGDAAAGVPVPTVRDTALATVTAATAFVGSCRAGTPDAGARQETEFQRGVLVGMLRQHGVVA